MEITESDLGFRGAMVGYHRMIGYSGGWLYVLQTLFYDLASAASIVFGITGIVMWYISRSRYRLGWVFLSAGFGLTLVMILYLMLAP